MIYSLLTKELESLRAATCPLCVHLYLQPSESAESGAFPTNKDLDRLIKSAAGTGFKSTSNIFFCFFVHLGADVIQWAASAASPEGSGSCDQVGC